MAANWLRSTLVVVLVVGMGQGFFLCRRGGGGWREGKNMLERSKFL